MSCSVDHCEPMTWEKAFAFLFSDKEVPTNNPEQDWCTRDPIYNQLIILLTNSTLLCWLLIPFNLPLIRMLSGRGVCRVLINLFQIDSARKIWILNEGFVNETWNRITSCVVFGNSCSESSPLTEHNDRLHQPYSPDLARAINRKKTPRKNYMSCIYVC